MDGGAISILWTVVSFHLEPGISRYIFTDHSLFGFVRFRSKGSSSLFILPIRIRIRSESPLFSPSLAVSLHANSRTPRTIGYVCVLRHSRRYDPSSPPIRHQRERKRFHQVLGLASSRDFLPYSRDLVPAFTVSGYREAISRFCTSTR